MVGTPEVGKVLVEGMRGDVPLWASSTWALP